MDFPPLQQLFRIPNVTVILCYCVTVFNHIQG